MESNAPPPFLVKTYDMVDDLSTDNIVSWGPTNNSFVVWNPPEFGRDLLPKYFKHSNFSSFVRQLNTYGFRKVDPDRWEFANEGFLRGQKQLLRKIIRRKPAHAQQQQPHGHNAASVVEVGKFGLEEEVERLKRDKNMLMQELVRLRQQQQSTDSQLQGMMQRLQGMEQRQQQMMSFLEKAVNNHGFLAHFVHQNESSSKKCRIKPDIIESQKDHSNVTPADGQIVKYQPIINEATKAILKELVKLDPSPRLDGDGSPQSRVSGVTLQEVPATSCLPLLANNQYSVKSLLVVGAEDSPPVSLSAWDMIMAKLSQLQTNNMDESSVDGKMPSLEIGSLSPDPQFQIEWPTSLMDDDMEELPSVGDPFWEKFLQSPPPAETEDMDDISKTSEEPLENGSGQSS